MFMKKLIKRELVAKSRRDWRYVAVVCILVEYHFFGGYVLAGMIAILYWEYSVIVTNLCSQDLAYFLSARVPIFFCAYL